MKLESFVWKAFRFIFNGCSYLQYKILQSEALNIDLELVYRVESAVIVLNSAKGIKKVQIGRYKRPLCQ